MTLREGSRLGPYQVMEPIGAGGMGEVYRATDTRLDRVVAIKVLLADVAADRRFRERFDREARAASSLNHPNICTLHDVGEHDGTAFLVMEYLEGETLGDRIAHERLPLVEAVQHGLTLLNALEVLHGRDLVHRDLKPSNVFLTSHGLKLLDFGLARSLKPDTDAAGLDLTQGMVVGTPRYMAPEAFTGRTVDARADLFAVGALLYEMLSGRPAFKGQSGLEIMHAVLWDKPPVLSGSAAIVAADRVIHRALAKRPEDRYQTAAAMARDLRDVLTRSDAAGTIRAHQVPRLIVLPFRMLRPDSDTEFLAFSLPDAITTSLSGLRSLIVRSTLAGGQFATDSPDLKALAEHAEVDLVLLGTLLRVGDMLQVNAQLLEAPAGTIVWSQRSQVAWHDIFRMQEDLTQRIVESLALPLSGRDRQLLQHDVPVSARSYEHYLRANQLANTPADWRIARDLYMQCVDEDPNYAPAWAHLGRMHRVIAKYLDLQSERGGTEGYARAEAAFERAFELNPDLPIAHDLYTALELERGRPQQAMLRLLERAKALSTDPHPFAGLVSACRYCGLLDASLSAHEYSRRIDPRVPNSFIFTLHALGRYQEVVDGDAAGFADSMPKVECLVRLGRPTEALTLAKATESSGRLPVAFAPAFPFLRALAEDSAQRLQEHLDEGTAQGVRQFDPEWHYFWSLYASRAGDGEQALALLRRAIEGAYFCFPAMAHDPWFDPLRAHPEFIRLLLVAEDGHREAKAAFAAAGGDRLLGLPRET